MGYHHHHHVCNSGESLGPLYLQRKSEGAILLLHDNGAPPTVFFGLARRHSVRFHTLQDL
jgi:hypothetical protein